MISKKHKFQQATIIGVGLMGGSLALDLRKKNIAKKIVGFDQNKKNIFLAKKRGLITHVGKDLQQELAQSDLVVLAMPVLTLEKQLAELASFIPKTTLVIDLGSTKSAIVKGADLFFIHGNFIGCHPMTGSENSGAKASVENLFQEATCLMTPGLHSKSFFIKKAKTLWQNLGAHVVVMPPDSHDNTVAACSHLPHVLAFVFFKAVTRSFNLKILLKIAGQSFKSFQRLASSDARLWSDIFISNQEKILVQIQGFKKVLNEFEGLIQRKDEKKIFDFIVKK